MDRPTWLKQKRQRIEERMDTLWAPLYDEKWGQYPNDSHRAMLDRFLALCPPGGTILDAACGTGVVTKLAAERVAPNGAVSGLTRLSPPALRSRAPLTSSQRRIRATLFLRIYSATG